MNRRLGYAVSDGLNIAYEEYGEGPVDIVVTSGPSHLDVMWTDPGYSDFMNSLAQFARVIVYDKRGMGLSDAVTLYPTIEDLSRDLGAVIDAAGCERPALFGWSEGGPISAYYAATNPDRVRTLIMYGSFARGDLAPNPDPSYPLDETGRYFEKFQQLVDTRWGEGESLQFLAPSRGITAFERRAWGIGERAATSPGAVGPWLTYNRHLDVTGVLAAIQTPTLVMHRTNDPLPVAGGRYIADRVPGATFLELPGDDHIPHLSDFTPIVKATREALDLDAAPLGATRVLRTIAFTDIVDSTTHAERLGDADWLKLLKRHDHLTRSLLERHRGTILHPTGDGFALSFDGPTNAVEFARELNEEAVTLGVRLRVGVHTAECEIHDARLGGIALHAAARICALAAPGQIVVSHTSRHLLDGSGLSFEDCGIHQLRGIASDFHLFAVRPSTVAMNARSVRPTEPRLSERLFAAQSRYLSPVGRAVARTIRRFA